jgi:hypothetical protein
MRELPGNIRMSPTPIANVRFAERSRFVVHSFCRKTDRVLKLVSMCLQFPNHFKRQVRVILLYVPVSVTRPHMSINFC